MLLLVRSGSDTRCLEYPLNILLLIFLHSIFPPTSLLHTFFMRRNRSLSVNDRFKPVVNNRSAAWKYFNRDQTTNEAKCNLCGLILKLLNFSTSNLRFHLDSQHKIDLPSLSQRPNRSLLQRKLTKSLREKSKNQHTNSSQQFVYYTQKPPMDWLSAFNEELSPVQDNIVHQSKDHEEIVHATQFMDPLKYVEYRRYAEEDLQSIRQMLKETGYVLNPEQSNSPLADVVNKSMRYLQETNLFYLPQDRVIVDMENWRQITIDGEYKIIVYPEIFNQYGDILHITSLNSISDAQMLVFSVKSESNQIVICGILEISSSKPSQQKYQKYLTTFFHLLQNLTPLYIKLNQSEGSCQTLVSALNKIIETHQLKTIVINCSCKQKDNLSKLLKTFNQKSAQLFRDENKGFNFSKRSNRFNKEREYVQDWDISLPDPCPDQFFERIPSLNGSDTTLNKVKAIKQPNYTIYNILDKLQRESDQQISHVRYLSPIYLQIFQIHPLSDSSCRLAKYSLLYELHNLRWVCNCRMIYVVGLPCPHIIKIVGIMGGSLKYYINTRWIVQRICK